MWYVAPSARTRSGFGPVVLRSSTCTDSSRWLPSSAASRPIGPAPVISTLFGFHSARRPIRSMWSHAFATTLAGSSSMPTDARAGSRPTANLGCSRQRSRAKPGSPLMPCSVYRPLRHMSHSSTAQFAQGTGSGWRTTPATRSPGCNVPVGSSSTRPSDSCPSTSRSWPGGASPYSPATIS